MGQSLVHARQQLVLEPGMPCAGGRITLQRAGQAMRRLPVNMRVCSDVNLEFKALTFLKKAPYLLSFSLFLFARLPKLAEVRLPGSLSVLALRAGGSVAGASLLASTWKSRVPR